MRALLALLPVLLIGACTNQLTQCVLCYGFFTAGGGTEKDPISVREWPTSLGRVKETFWAPVSLPDQSFDCSYTLVTPEGAASRIGEVSLEVDTCDASRPPSVDAAGHLIVQSPGAFFVWKAGWKRGRAVPLRNLSFRNTYLSGLPSDLVIQGDVWRLSTSSVPVFESNDGGATWRPLHEDART